MANKVNISDIVNNLTSTATNKPLSAAQGKALNDGKVSIYLSSNTEVRDGLSSANNKIGSFIHYDGTKGKCFVYIDGNPWYISISSS